MPRGRKYSKTRKIGGKTYHLRMSAKNKSDAKHYTKQMRKQGKKARMIKVTRGYAIYSRPR